MTWAALIPVLIQFGLPVAEKLWALVQSNAAPTQADWDSLKALGATSRKQDMISAMVNAGIAPESAQWAAFLALVS